MNTLKLTIRKLNYPDCAIISSAFQAQGWHKPVGQYENYLQQQESGSRDILVAEIGGSFAGYLTIVWNSAYPPFLEQGIPEIVDLNVLKKFQRMGIATALMDAAERRIRLVSDTAGIGFGITADYGAAQIMYIKRGYLPDGNGIVRAAVSVGFGDTVKIDDEIVIYLTRRL